MRSILIAALLAAGTAHAGYVFDSPQVRIHFADTACEHPQIAGALAPLGKANAATVYFQGQQLQACWMRLPDGAFFVMDETGDYGTVPSEAVKVAKEV